MTSPPALTNVHGVAASAEAFERYRDLGLLGRGGMAEVRRVRDLHMRRVVAMKIMARDLVTEKAARERFLHEARVTGSLQHPSIPPVHEVGETADGRPWFTMKQVKGRTFGGVIEALHGRSNGEQPSLESVVNALLKACDAVAYAHSRGIIHRDLKPDNLMVGRFGEVYVMDWGLALRRDVTRTARDFDEALLAGPPGISSDGDDTMPTRPDDSDDGIAGTLAYMSPEQAAGGGVAEPSDVYALGAVLYEVMAGFPPFSGSPREIWTAIFRAPPVPLHELAPGPTRPADLQQICERAMRREPGDRYPHAGALADALRGWLDGTRRRERARHLVSEADALWQSIEEQRAAARALAERAASLLRPIRPYDPIEQKAPGWALQDHAAQIERTAAVDEVMWQQLLRSALNELPDWPPAHERLADYYRAKHEEREFLRDAEGAARAEALLRTHDRGLHAAYLRAEGRLTLHTDPPGAEATILRFERDQRRLTARPCGSAVTPMDAAVLPAGSYVIELRLDGHPPVRYPVFLERDRAWTGTPPGAGAPVPIAIPPAGALGPDDIYIPAGPFMSGGDPKAVEALRADRPWLDAFVIRRFPVTQGEYLAFLNDLIAAGRDDEALRRAPKPPAGREQDEVCLWIRDTAGRFQLEDERQAQLPVVLVDWFDAVAYAAWLADRTGTPWRLPSELEWEKAARGVDGRFLPWGDDFEHTYACIVHSSENVPGPVPVDSYPIDESPYGVRGLAGNVRDWCLDRWHRDGPALTAGRLVLPDTPDDDSFRSSRGGAWTAVAEHVRMASRFAAKPTERFRGQGFRLAHS